jgi:hypothetical protein
VATGENEPLLLAGRRAKVPHNGAAVTRREVTIAPSSEIEGHGLTIATRVSMSATQLS